jgi:hypothetical protein
MCDLGTRTRERGAFINGEGKNENDVLKTLDYLGA